MSPQERKEKALGTASNEALHREVTGLGACVYRQGHALARTKMLGFTWYKLGTSILRKNCTAARNQQDTSASMSGLVTHLKSPILLRHISVAADLLEKSQRAAAWEREKKYQVAEEKRKENLQKKRGIEYLPRPAGGGDGAKLLWKDERNQRSHARAYRMHKIAESKAAGRGKDFRKDKGAMYVSLRTQPKPFQYLKHHVTHSMKLLKPCPKSTAAVVVKKDDTTSETEKQKPPTAEAAQLLKRAKWKKWQQAAREKKKNNGSDNNKKNKQTGKAVKKGQKKENKNDNKKKKKQTAKGVKKGATKKKRPMTDNERKTKSRKAKRQLAAAIAKSANKGEQSEDKNTRAASSSTSKEKN